MPDLVDFDTETSGLHPDDGALVTTVSVAWRDHTGVIYAGAWPFGQGRENRPKREKSDGVTVGPAEYAFLIDWLSRAGGGLCGHNIPFDIQMIAGQFRPGYATRDLSSRFRWDTMVAAQELWPSLPSHALKSLAVRFLGDDADAEQKALWPHLGTKTDPRYDRVPWEVMKPYALKDAIYTNRLRWMQAEHLTEGSAFGRHIGTQLALTRAIIDMHLIGVPYDPALSLTFAEQLQTEIDELVPKLPFRPTTPAAVTWFFASDDGPKLKPLGYTDGGKPKLTADIVDRLVDRGVEHADTWQRIGKLKSAISKWYKPFGIQAGEDLRIRSQFRQGHVKSGRLSASRINLQAVPNDYKIDLPVPTPRQVIGHAVATQHPGWELWDLDLEQAELRIASMYAQCQPMLDMISQGRDAHGETATALFGTQPDDPKFKVHRQVAKRGNFSLIFGSGPDTFREMVLREAGVSLSRPEATDIVYRWRDLYPEFGRSIKANMALVDQLGYVALPNGRRRYYRSFEESHSAFNQLVQSMQAEFTKEWLIYANRLLRPYRRQGGGLLLTVHDSLVMLLPETEAPDLVRQIQDTGVAMWSRFFPGVPGGIDAGRWDCKPLIQP